MEIRKTALSLLITTCIVTPVAAQEAVTAHRQLLDRYCVTCHNDRLETAGLSLEHLNVENPREHAEVWEKVVRKLRTVTMPPPNRTPPPVEESAAVRTWLETNLDAVAEMQPFAGRNVSLRRLNRTE